MVNTDAERVARAQAGDREAFTALVTDQYALILRVSLRMTGNRADAEDVAHEACIKLARALPQYRGDAAFTTWLYRLVVNCAHDWRKSQRRHEHEETTAASEPAAPESASSEVRLQQVLRQIETLGNEFLETVVLVIGEGLTHREAGDALGVKESTISWRLHEIRRRLAGE